MKLFLLKNHKINKLYLLIFSFIFFTNITIFGATCTPTSATLCINGDDDTSVWLNGNYVGAFPYVNWDSPNFPKCVSIPIAWLNATGNNVIALAVTDTAGGQIWGSYTLDVTCSGGQHAYISSNSGGIKLYATNIYNSPPPNDGSGNAWNILNFNDTSWGNAIQVGVTTWAKPLYDPSDGRMVRAWSYSNDASSGANQWDPSGMKMLYMRKTFTLNPVTPLPSPTFSIQKSASQTSMITGGPVTFTITICVSGGYTRDPVLLTDWWTSPTYCAWSMGNPYYYDDLNNGQLTRSDGSFTLYFPLGFEANTCKTFVYELNPCWFTTDWYTSAWCTGATNYARVTWTTGVATTTISVQLYCPSPSNTFTRTRTATLTPTYSRTNTAQITPTTTPTRTSTFTFTRSPTTTWTRTATLSPSRTSTPSLTRTNTLPSSPTFTWTRTVSPSASYSQTLSPSPSRTPTPTYSRTPSPSPSPSRTPTPTYTRTPTPSPSPTPSRTPTSTYTRTPTPTNTRTSTPSSTFTYTNTRTPTFTYTDTISSNTPTVTPTWTRTSTRTGTPTNTLTITSTPTFTNTVSPSPTHSRTPTPTYTRTPTQSYTNTRTNTQTPTRTWTDTISSNTPTITPTHTRTSTRTGTPTNTLTITPTFTNTISPSPTNSRTATPSFTQTATNSQQPTITDTISSNTPTITPTHTRTSTRTGTPTNTLTITPTFTNTISPSPTNSRTATPSFTQTATNSQQPTITDTISSNTPTNTPTYTNTLTVTPTYTRTLTATSTRTSTVTLTGTPTATNTLTSTETMTQTNTMTFTPTPTYTATFTLTATVTITPDVHSALLDMTLISYGENAQAGAKIEYKIIIENKDSSISAYNIRVWDTLPGEVEFIDSYFVVQPEILDGVVIWQLPKDMELKPGEKMIIEYRVKMTNTDGKGFITNTVSADYQDEYYNDTFGNGRHPVITSNVNEYPEEPIIAYPNPYKISGESKGIKFANLPLNSIVQIYTISGESVITLSTLLGTRVVWDGRNSKGKEVGTGIYYYVILNKNSKEIVKGKIFIVK